MWFRSEVVLQRKITEQLPAPVSDRGLWRASCPIPLTCFCQRLLGLRHHLSLPQCHPDRKVRGGPVTRNSRGRRGEGRQRGGRGIVSQPRVCGGTSAGEGGNKMQPSQIQ